MSLLRWIPTFLAFPLGGLIAMTLLGSMSDPLIALAGGLVVGLCLGGAQWLALGRTLGAVGSGVGSRVGSSVGSGWRWLLITAVASSAALALGVLVAGPPTTTASAVAVGAITGALVGIAQGLLLRRGARVALLWAAVVAASWSAGWLVTSLVIIDLDRGHAVFGASGAILVTLVTGAVLRLIVGPRARRSAGPSARQARA